MTAILTSLLLSVLLADPVRDDGVTVPTTPAIVKKVEMAREFLAASQWSDAAELLQQLSSSEGTQLIPTGGGRWLPARTMAQSLLARMPPEGLKIYRQRIDPQAREWYEQAKATQDEAGLERVVQEAFASSWGDDALLLWGDLAWERGDLAWARQCWRKLVQRAVPPGVTDPYLLIYPDSKLPLADVRARLVLCSLFLGETERAAEELASFATEHPDAEGLLAGRKGKLVDILRELAADQKPYRPALPQLDLPTFGGRPQRTTQGMSPIEIGPVRWSSPLSRAYQLMTMDRLTLVQRGLQPVFHPAVWQDQVYVCDEMSIYGWNLMTGQPLQPGNPGRPLAELFRLNGAGQGIPVFPKPSAGIPQFSLTVSEGRLYTRLGNVNEGRHELSRPQSMLVCVDPQTTPSTLVWQVDADSVDMAGGGGWMFEGAPLVHEGRVYVAMRKSDLRAAMAVLCLSADRGQVIWFRSILTGGEAWTSRGEEKHSPISQQLLSLADGHLFFNTNAGGVVSLGARDGRIRWITSYRRTASSSAGEFGLKQLAGPNPPVVESGRVFVAPTDAAEMYCLDAETGLVRWKRQHEGKLRTVLGVAGAMVYGSGAELWALDVQTGAIRWAHRPADPEGAGFGRGALSLTQVYFSTREELQLFDLRTGAMQKRIRLPIDRRLPSGGNLVLAGGMLLIALPDRIAVLGDGGPALPSLKKLVTERPDDLPARLMLASAEAAGVPSQNDRGRTVSLNDLARDVSAASAERSWLERLILAEAEQFAKRKQRDRVAELVRLLEQMSTSARDGGAGAAGSAATAASAASEQFSPREVSRSSRGVVARAKLWLVDLEAAAGQTDRAVELLQQLIHDPALTAVREASSRLPRQSIPELARQRLMLLRPELAGRDTPRVEADDLPGASAPRDIVTNPQSVVARTEVERTENAAGRTAATRDEPRGLLQAGWASFRDEEGAWIVPEQWSNTRTVRSAAGPQVPGNRFSGVWDAAGLLFWMPARSGHGLEAVSLQTGEIVWSLRVAEQVRWAGACGRIVLLQTDHSWLGVAVKDGTVVWERRRGEESLDGLVTQAMSGAAGTALPGRDRSDREEARLAGSERRVRWVGPDRVAEMDSSGVTVRDSGTGSVVWQYAPGNDQIREFFCQELRSDADGDRVAEPLVVRLQPPGELIWLDVSTGAVQQEFSLPPGTQIGSVRRLSADWWTFRVETGQPQLYRADTGNTTAYQGPLSFAHGSCEWALAEQDSALLLKDRQTLSRVDLVSGLDLWSDRFGAGVMSESRPPVVKIGAILCRYQQGIVIGSDWETGQRRWDLGLGAAGLKVEFLPAGAWLAIATRDDQAARGMLIDPATGDVVQVLIRPTTASRLAWHSRPEGWLMLGRRHAEFWSWDE